MGGWVVRLYGYIGTLGRRYDGHIGNGWDGEKMGGFGLVWTWVMLALERW